MSALLSDQIDRLTQRTRSIKATAAEVAAGDPSSRLFTHAVLYAQLGDLMRDVDSTELGLFTLEKPTQSSKLEPQQAHVKRIHFVGATPLRRNVHRREDPSDPELYAKAALKCLHKYQDVRPMPRAQSQLAGIVNELERTRRSIGKLHSSLQKQQPAPAENGPKQSQVKEEEERIAALRARMEELNQRKKQLAAATPATSEAVKGTKALRKIQEPLPPSSPEDKFWATPGDASRTLKFAPNSLLDEQVEFNDLDDASFSMPTPKREVVSAPFSRFTSMDPTVLDAQEDPIELPQGSHDFDEDSNDPLPDSQAESPEGEPDSPSTPTATEAAPPGGESEGRVRITHEVERIAIKMLTVYADVLQLPRSPSPKEIVSRLKEVSNESPAPESPSHSSLSTATGANGVTAQQVLIAFVLYQLLSSAGHSMTLNGLKDALSAKITSSGLSVSALGQNPTRIIYGCVAKRILKIDRTGKEQIVKFDA